jgi:4-hydroxyphenylpyruvate dioxygenase
VLDLRPEESHEIAAPYGLVRSLALSGEGIRIALNVPVVAGGRERLASLQHVAFESRDIFETARSVQALGLRALPISANYYEDLAARFELDASLLETIREHNILYDRDEGGGELFHFCTPALGDALFFEVVQRLGSYRGMGAPNASVWMAAQQRAIGTYGRCDGGE